MFPHSLYTACGFNRTGRHLIMEGVCIIIWTRNFESSGLSVVVPFLGFTDHLIPLDFFSGMPCQRHLHQLKNGPCGSNIHRCRYYPWKALYFRTCPPISITGVVSAYLPMVAISNASWDAFMSWFLFIIVSMSMYVRVIKRFTLHSVLWPYCL